MKRFLLSILLFLCIFICSNNFTPLVFGVHEQELIRYQFEENGGLLFVDTSQDGNNNHATVIGASWDGVNQKWGDYASTFDGNDDYAVLIEGEQFPSIFTISLWARPDFLNTEPKCVFCVKDTLEQHSFRFFPADDTIKYLYQDVNGTSQNVTLDNVSFTDNQWYHLVLSVNTENGNVNYWRDSILTFNETLNVTPNHLPLVNKVIYIGTDFTQEFDYRGELDEYRFFNFQLDESQIGSLFNSNTINLEHEDIPTSDLEIITSLTPENSSNVTNPVNFRMTLNHISTCDLYVDELKTKTVSGGSAYNFNLNLESGEREYFVHCYYIDDGTKYEDYSSVRTINVFEPEPTTIIFNFVSSDFNINNEMLYVVTPCLKKGIAVWGVDNGYNSNANPNPMYFQKVVNGIAEFELIPTEYEFCLVNGLINYDSNNFTENWKANTVYKVTKIGKFDLPNDLITSHTISLEMFDIYKLTNPKAWGTSWVSLIGSVIAMFIGITLIAIGVYIKTPQAIIVGGLLTMMALGYELSNIIWGIL